MIDFTAVLSDTKQIKISTQQQEKLVMEATWDWNRFTELTRPARRQSVEAWQLYRQNHPDYEVYSDEDSENESFASVRTGVINQAVDAIHAQQYQTLFPADERFFKLLPQNELAKKNEDLVQAKMMSDMQAAQFLIYVFQDIKNMILDGTSAVAIPFERRYKTKAVYQFPKLGGLLPQVWRKPKRHLVERIEYESTPFFPLMFDDWRADPTVDDFRDTPFIWRQFVHPQQLKAMQNLINTEDVQPYKDYVEGDEFRRLKALYNDLYYDRSMETQFIHNDLAQQNVCLFQKWGDFYIDDELYENCVLIYSNNFTFHGFFQNEYDHQQKPFLVSPYISMPGSIMGKSATVDSVPLAHAMDTLMNQALDIISRCANPTVFYNSKDAALSEYFSGGSVVVAPGEAIPITNMGNIQPFEINIGVIPQIIMPISQAAKETIRENTGGVPYATGGPDKASNDRTLGEVQILAAGTSTRFQTIIDYYEKAKLEPYLKIMFSNLRQFMSEPTWIDKFPMPLTPNMLKQMEFNFKATGSRSVMERNKETSDINIFLTQFLPSLIQAGYAKVKPDILEVDVAGMAKRLVDLSEISNSDEYLTVIASQEQNVQETQNAPQMGGIPNGPTQVPQLAPRPAGPNLAPIAPNAGLANPGIPA